ncbi:MAG: serine hydrolase, partial [bacterium]|nr:serine hydrolase [bacterium]
KITGKKLREIVKEKLFIQLNMNNSALVLKDAQQCAAGHTPDMKPQKKRIPKRANGAASLHTTAEDYARFLIAVADGDGLAVKTREEMLRPQISISDDDPTLSWGLGFALEKTAGDTVFWHWGDNGPFKAFTVVSMNKKTGFIYFANSTNGLSIMKEMNALLMDGKYSMYSWLDYPQLGDPGYVLQKMVADNQLEAAIKKYKEWLAKEPGRFKEHDLNSIGYFLLGKKKIKEAIKIFKLNVEAYPDSANVYDSLAEAYMKDGDKELAIKNYEKSVQLDPENHTGIEALKKLKM